jgi:hypothetical protein
MLVSILVVLVAILPLHMSTFSSMDSQQLIHSPIGHMNKVVIVAIFPLMITGFLVRRSHHILSLHSQLLQSENISFYHQEMSI